MKNARPKVGPIEAYHTITKQQAQIEVLHTMLEYTAKQLRAYYFFEVDVLYYLQLQEASGKPFDYVGFVKKVKESLANADKDDNENARMFGHKITWLFMRDRFPHDAFNFEIPPEYFDSSSYFGGEE